MEGIQQMPTRRAQDAYATLQNARGQPTDIYFGIWSAKSGSLSSGFMKQDPQGVLGVEGAGEVGASYEFTLEKDPVMGKYRKIHGKI